MLLSVRRLKARYVLGAIVIGSLLFWYLALPIVRVHYSKGATDELRYIWNTQHSIHKEGLLPGQATYDTGHIFPDRNFFIIFDWWSEKSLRRCIDITPQWAGAMDIYLNAAGRIDRAATSPEVMAHLKQCEGEAGPFRP